MLSQYEQTVKQNKYASSAQLSVNGGASHAAVPDLRRGFYGRCHSMSKQLSKTNMQAVRNYL